MPERGFDVRKEVLALWKQPTERDKQVRVGASNIGQPCARCLAEDLSKMLHDEPPNPKENPNWLGAAIGTAVHERLEQLITQNRPSWLSERRVILGRLEDYGVIKSTLDLYVEPYVIDFKTTTRAKLTHLKHALTSEATEYDTTTVVEARYKATSYLYQVMLYAKALEDEGYPVETVALLFICRDGVGDKDVWVHEAPYDRDLSHKAWDRLGRLWDALRNGRDPGTLPSDPACWTCRFEGHNREKEN